MNRTTDVIYKMAKEFNVQTENMPISDVYYVIIHMCEKGYVIDVIEFLGVKLTASELLFFTYLDTEYAFFVLQEWLLVNHGINIVNAIREALNKL